MIWKRKQNQQLFYEDIFKKLQEKNVRYLMIGGVAVNLYGISRATGDMDMMIDMDKKNVLNFVAVMNALGLKPKVPVKPEELADPIKVGTWKKEKNMKVFSFMHPDNPYITIDVMTENYIDFKKAYNNKTEKQAWGIRVSIVSKEDLIKLKEISGREIDLDDIKKLNKYGTK